MQPADSTRVLFTPLILQTAREGLVADVTPKLNQIGEALTRWVANSILAKEWSEVSLDTQGSIIERWKELVANSVERHKNRIDPAIEVASREIWADLKSREGLRLRVGRIDDNERANPEFKGGTRQRAIIEGIILSELLR